MSTAQKLLAPMDMEVLRKEITDDEGCKYEIYLDHLGLPTCGIGHLIKETDEEHGKAVGTKVSEERVKALFDEDIKVSIAECEELFKTQFSSFDALPTEARYILTNMMFNMGKPRLSKFVKMRKAIEDFDFAEASIQMKDSKWYTQVTNRADRLVKRMKALEVTE